jgi:hypothetical protein
MLIRWIHRVFQFLRQCSGREEFATFTRRTPVFKLIRSRCHGP